MKLEEIVPGKVIAGVVPGKLATVVAAEMRGVDALELVYRADGTLGQRRLSRADEDGLLLASNPSWWFRLDPKLLAVPLVLLIAFGLWRYWPRPSSGPASDDFPVFIRTNGGMLEVGKVRYRRPFNLTEVLVVAGVTVPFCKATASYTIDTHITYRVRLAKDWAAPYRDHRLQITAPKLEPALPVAFDTSSLKATLQKCPFIPNGTQDVLLKSISTKLANDARSSGYIQYARNNGARDTVEEFARKWLVSQKTYNIPADTPIDVRFEDE